jgi:hypothetical protein
MAAAAKTSSSTSTSTTTQTGEGGSGTGGGVRRDQRHYHYLHKAAAWAVPLLLLAILLLLSLEALVKGLVRLAAATPAGPIRKLIGGLLSLLTRALGGGGPRGELPLSLTAVLLTSVLISILVLAIGIFQLVELKAEEMRDLRGLRTQQEETRAQQKGPTTRQRRSG